MRLPNHAKFAGVICDVIEILSGALVISDLPKLNAIQVASLWNPDEAFAMLTSLKGLISNPDAQSVVDEARQALSSCYTGYAILLAEERTAQRDYAFFYAAVKTRQVHKLEAGVMPLRILKKQVEG